MFNHPIPLNRKNFQTIIRFYLLECPVRTFSRSKKDIIGVTIEDPHPKYHYEFHPVSHRGISFQERGIDGKNLNILRYAMKRAAPGIVLEAADDTPIAPNTDEYIVIKKNENNVSVTEGYFYCLRNGFAHGSFDVAGKYYLFENSAGDKLKGIARLKESTLLTWIQLCSMTPSELKRFGK